MFDHLIRQKPSEQLIPIRRNFYPPTGPSERLDEIVEVSIGAYIAMKISNVSAPAILVAIIAPILMILSRSNLTVLA